MAGGLELATLVVFADEISSAAMDVRVHKQDCRILGHYLHRLTDILEADWGQAPPSRSILDDLRGALEDANTLVKRCRQLPADGMGGSPTGTSEFQTMHRRLAASKQLLVPGSTHTEQPHALLSVASALRRQHSEAPEHGPPEPATPPERLPSGGICQPAAPLMRTRTEDFIAAFKSVVLGIAEGRSPPSELLTELEAAQQMATKRIRQQEMDLQAVVAKLAHASGSTNQAQKRSAFSARPPPELLCPIGMELMQQPVLLVETGETYDRVNIERWFQSSHITCPLRGQRLKDRSLVPNWSVARQVASWKATHGEANAHVPVN